MSLNVDYDKMDATSFTEQMGHVTMEIFVQVQSFRRNVYSYEMQQHARYVVCGARHFLWSNNLIDSRKITTPILLQLLEASGSAKNGSMEIWISFLSFFD